MRTIYGNTYADREKQREKDMHSQMLQWPLDIWFGLKISWHTDWHLAGRHCHTIDSQTWQLNWHAVGSDTCCNHHWPWQNSWRLQTEKNTATINYQSYASITQNTCWKCLILVYVPDTWPEPYVQTGVYTPDLHHVTQLGYHQVNSLHLFS